VNKPEINMKLCDIMYLLRKRRMLLLLEPDNYTSVVNFLIGFNLVLSKEYPNKIIFNDWLMEKEGCAKSNETWYFYVLKKTDQNKNLALEIIINHFEDYLIEIHKY
jgi:hypothetical protein